MVYFEAGSREPRADSREPGAGAGAESREQKVGSRSKSRGSSKSSKSCLDTDFPQGITLDSSYVDETESSQIKISGTYDSRPRSYLLGSERHLTIRTS